MGWIPTCAEGGVARRGTAGPARGVWGRWSGQRARVRGERGRSAGAEVARQAGAGRRGLALRGRG